MDKAKLKLQMSYKRKQFLVKALRNKMQNQSKYKKIVLISKKYFKI